MEKKITYVEALDKAIEALDDVEVTEKLEALKASIVKKQGSKSKKTTEAQAEIDAKVLEVLTDEAVSATSIFAKNAEGFGSVPKVTASLTRLVADGKAVKVAIDNGKKNGYKLA